MFCPKCKAEYREGFTRCADCDAELVRELPAEPRAQPAGIMVDETQFEEARELLKDFRGRFSGLST